MNKLIITALCICGFIQIHAQEIEKKSIKHELARMPEQASWTVERWNINNVDFELKEISKATKIQPARFELKLEVPSNGKSKLKTPLAKYLDKNKITQIEIAKNNILYYSVKTLFFSGNLKNYTHWHLSSYQMQNKSGGLKTINKNHRLHLDFQEADFPDAKWLSTRDFHQGVVNYKGKKYHLYQQKSEIDTKSRVKGLENLEFIFNAERTGEPIDEINYKKLAALPSIEELIDENLHYTLLVDIETNHPTYYCDRLSLYKYIYSNDKEASSIEMPPVPELVQARIKWYIENVLPEMERRAQKAAN